MWLLDQWAERHILDAQQKGEFDNLPGSGEPLLLDDDSHVPEELRAGYRLLKNAGCLPPELEYRKEAVMLVDLLNSVQRDHPDFQLLHRRLSLLEMKLRQAGLSTDFLRGDYADKLQQKMNEEQSCTALVK
ncbi:DUF1992 domain-containing protein [Kosakonia pseudosacchari]|uniref:DnaJ homologue subfamily C member 28 conserved domain-containing protein n=1 Tax=Kosakonia pseudosacchari TaxID=1646340 RepID=A0ABX4IU36_9ENTR|nr:DUF1992 domain-containing protein [Kosakonia pseudosacchari]PDO89368.1 hypothetical protein BK796_05370 [Kosakonia pseudosacchari]